MVSNTDLGWCFEHKCWMTTCADVRHSWETNDTFTERQKITAHPECPSCRCKLPLLPAWPSS